VSFTGLPPCHSSKYIRYYFLSIIKSDVSNALDGGEE